MYQALSVTHEPGCTKELRTHFMNGEARGLDLRLKVAKTVYAEELAKRMGCASGDQACWKSANVQADQAVNGGKDSLLGLQLEAARKLSFERARREFWDFTKNLIPGYACYEMASHWQESTGKQKLGEGAMCVFGAIPAAAAVVKIGKAAKGGLATSEVLAGGGVPALTEAAALLKAAAPTRFTEAQVRANAALSAADRPRAIQQTLGLDADQAKLVTRAHTEVPCPIYGCSPAELRRKLEIMKDLPEGKAVLAIRSGLAGMPAPPKIGQAVALPRTHGGYTNGEVMAVENGQVTVRFTDVSGKSMIKTVGVDELAPAMTQALADVRAGTSVGVPRSDGSLTQGQVVKVDPDGKLVVAFRDARNGQQYTKRLAPDELRAPLPEGLLDLRPGQQVSIPRSSGARSDAEVISVGPTHANVQWRVGDRVATKSVPISDLRPAGAAQRVEPAAAPRAPPLPAHAARPPPGFEIGSTPAPHGHYIAGGASRGRGSGGREIITVDWAKDQALNSFYKDVAATAGTRADPRDVFAAVQKRVAGGDKGLACAAQMEVQYLNQSMGIGEVIKRGAGVCRHLGILNAAVLERMIVEGRMAGKVYYVRGRAHGWAVYETPAGERMVLDAMQQTSVVPMTGTRYFHGHGPDGRALYEPYADAFRRMASSN